LYIYDPAAITVGAGLPAMLFVTANPFPKAHHFVTERPSVAQSHASVTKSHRSKNLPRKISSTPEPLIQALSSCFQNIS
jgi:hypothetical protein